MTLCKTQDDLAAEIGVDSRQLRRYRKYPEAPQSMESDDWLAWLAARKADKSFEAPVSGVRVADLPGENAYDDAVAKGSITYSVARTREQSRHEMLANDLMEIEKKKASGELVTRQDAEKVAALIRDRMSRRLERTLAQAAMELVSTGLSADLRANVIAVIERLWDANAGAE